MSKPKATPHVFQADPDLPHPDHAGRRVCAVCRLVGRPDDPHHTMPEVAEQEESRRRAGGDA